MKTVIQIFKQLQNTSGKKDKEAIIAQNADNELFKKCLVFLLDDNVITGIAKKSIQKKIKHDGHVMVFDSWDICMEYFKENNTGRDYDILLAKSFIKYQDEEDRWFYEGMITKSLKIGCDKKTVNKVIPNLIFEWKVQLGSPYDKLKLKKDEKFYLSRKCNGIRASYKNGKLMSRQGKEFTGINHIIKDIETLNLDTYFIDGELIRKNIDNIDDGDNFRLSTSIANSKTENKEELQLIIFDMFPVETIIDNDKTVENYGIRKQRMLDIQKIIEQKNIKNLSIVEMYYEGSDQSQIQYWLDKISDEGFEGIMLNKDTPYYFKRTTTLIKCKKFKEIDLRCVGVKISDTGKYKGLVGAITCKYGKFTVDVGSGLDDEERNRFSKHPEQIINRIVTIRYQDESNNQNGGESLQFGRFVAIRFDKDIADDEVKEYS